MSRLLLSVERHNSIRPFTEVSHRLRFCIVTVVFVTILFVISAFVTIAFMKNVSFRQEIKIGAISGFSDPPAAHGHGSVGHIVVPILWLSLDVAENLRYSRSWSERTTPIRANNTYLSLGTPLHHPKKILSVTIFDANLNAFSVLGGAFSRSNAEVDKIVDAPHDRLRKRSLDVRALGGTASPVEKTIRSPSSSSRRP